MSRERLALDRRNRLEDKDVQLLPQRLELLGALCPIRRDFRLLEPEIAGIGDAVHVVGNGEQVLVRLDGIRLVPNTHTLEHVGCGRVGDVLNVPDVDVDYVGLDDNCDLFLGASGLRQRHGDDGNEDECDQFFHNGSLLSEAANMFWLFGCNLQGSYKP